MKNSVNHYPNGFAPNGVFRTRRLLCMILISAFIINGELIAQTCTKTEATSKKSLACVLYKSAVDGNLEKIKTLVEDDQTNINSRFKKEETLLTLAAYNGHYDIVDYLIENGANIHLRNNSNNTALLNASKKGYDDIVTLLLENGAKVNARGNGGKTALHYAAEYSHPKVVEILTENGCYIDPQDDNKRTPLIYASWRGNADVLQILIDNDADVQHVVSGNNTILHNLAWGAEPEALKVVLRAGADANAFDDNGFLPLHTAVRNCNPGAVKLLVPYTKNIDQKEKHYGNTALHIAAKNGDLKSFKLLTEAGADHNVLNNHNQKPLYLNTQYGQTELVSYSISEGLATKADLKQVEINRKESLKSPKTGDVNVHYCGHSGWVVSTKNTYLIFDYWSSNKVTQNPGLINGTITPGELKGKDVYVFASHDHGDHYDTIIYSWQEEVKNITYILGFDPEKARVHKKTGYHGPDYVYINDNQTEKVDDVKVTTLKSNDTGQGFLVEVDGVSIYHPGDHALFTLEDKPGFTKEIDFIASQNSTIDIAFLPVTGCPVRWKKEYITEGFFYSIDKLNPKQVYPMHAFGREYMLKEFADLAVEKKVSANFVCVENSGDHSNLNNAMVADK